MRNLLLIILFALIFHTGYSQGFNTTASNWNLPAGGYVDAGITNSFLLSASTSANYGDTGCENWVAMDINGDALPDMVVTSELNANGTVTVFSPLSNPYWKVYLNNGTSFNSTPINWPVPSGGYISGGVTNGFFLTASTSANYGSIGCQNWVLQDINGDSKPDIIVTSQLNANTYVTVYSPASNPYWKVFLNTGTGFNTTPINWTLPSGGFIGSGVNNGFFLTASTSANYGDVGCQNWVLQDIDGDGKADIIATSQLNANTYVTVYSPTNNPYWKVFLNTGTGFNTTAINWTLPAGGFIDSGITNGFFLTASTSANYGDVGCQNWVLQDIDGDGKADLIATSQLNANTYVTVYSPTNNPYWKVFLNTGIGFNTNAINWTLPAGGFIDSGVTNGFFLTASTSANYGDVGCQNWELQDINGDGKADIIATSQLNANTYVTVYSPTNNPYWKVFLNTGTGFNTTAINWTLPAGGFIDSGVTNGFFLTASTSANYGDVGCQNWVIQDINGDGKADIIVTSQLNTNTYVTAYSPTNNPYWKVFINNGITGLMPMDYSSALLVYPNPFTDIITVQLSELLQSGTNYIICDNSGKKVRQGKLDYGSTNIDVNTLSKGMYFLKLEDGSAYKLVKH